MAKVTIGGVEYDLHPMKFKQLRKNASLLDRAQVMIAGLEGFSAISEASAILLEVFADRIGREEVTADFLEEAATVEEAIVFPAAFQQLLMESGFKAPTGEKQPDGAPADEEASVSSSTTQSAT